MTAVTFDPRLQLTRHPITPADVLAPCALTLLLFAGYFKGAPPLRAVPGDLSLWGALATLTACIGPILRMRLRPPRSALYFCGLWLTFSFAMLYVAERTSYSYVKINHLFTLTLLSAVAPILIFTTDLRKRIWYGSLGLMSAVVALIAVIYPDAKAADSERLAVDGSNTIATARAAGLGLVLLAAVMLVYKPRILITGPLALLLLWTTMRAGSRGPVIAVAITVGAVIAVRMLSGKQRKRRLAWMAAGACVVGWGIDRMLGSSFAVQRALGLTDERPLTTDESRSSLLRDSWSLIQHHPLGIGWGNGYNYFSPGTLLSSGYVQYTHNVFVEVTLEGGWIPGVVLIALTCISLARLWGTGATSPLPLAVAVFFISNATVSGDVNDNRTMFAALALGWITTARPATLSDE